MTKTILITGATDGIGLETAKMLAEDGHRLLLHGRSQAKLDAALAAVGGDSVGYLADLSRLEDVRSMVAEVSAAEIRIDVLINNAGILKAPQTKTEAGLDIRFVVNTLAPYVLAKGLLPKMPKDGRIVNLSSAAQASVDIAAMKSGAALGDMDAYAQSKLAITMWTTTMAESLPEGPVVVSVNPGSLLASKMVKEGFGIAGNDISIGAKILVEASLGDSFANASGQYFDNDSGRFAPPHTDGTNPSLRAAVQVAIEELVA